MHSKGLCTMFSRKISLFGDFKALHCEIRRLSGETIVDIIKEEFERLVEEDDDDFLLVKKNAG